MKKLKLLIILLVFATGCYEQDVEISRSNLKKIAYTNLEKESKLSSALEQIGLNKGARSGRLMSGLSEFRPDSILKVLQADSLNYAYTLALDGVSNDGTFKNLVFRRVETGFFAYVLEYVPEGVTIDINSFNGIVKKYDLEGNLIEEAQLAVAKFGSSNGRTKACFADVTVECVDGGGISTATGLPLPCLEWATVITIECDGGSGGGSGGATGGWFNFGTYIPDPYGGPGAGGGSSGGGSGGGSTPPNGDPSFEGGGAIGVLPVYLSKIELETWIEALTDPEEKRRMQLAYLKVHGASEFVQMIEDLMITPDLTVGEVWEINQTVNQVYLNQKAEFFIAIFNPTTVGTILSLGLNSVTLSTPVRTRYFGLVARYASTSVGKGYSSFEAFKRAHGAAGEGKAWHHLVQQTESNVQRFGAEKVHNVNNLIRIEHGAGSWHQRITNYYNTIHDFTGNKRFYEWVADKSFQEQYEWALRIMEITKTP